jgi:hypothetical protein
MNTKVASQKPTNRSTVMTGVIRWIALNIVFLLVLGLSLFLAAGGIDWQLGWIFLGIVTAGQIATTLMLLTVNPTLLGERAWMKKGSKPWDTVIVGLADAGWMVTVIVAGLDRRLNWSPHLGMGFYVVGFVLIMVGLILFLWAMVSNRYSLVLCVFKPIAVILWKPGAPTGLSATLVTLELSLHIWPAHWRLAHYGHSSRLL